MNIFRRKPDPYEAPTPQERRRSDQASAHLARTVADVEGVAYEVPQPVPSWPDVAPEQDRWCGRCHHRAIHLHCWKCGHLTSPAGPGAAPEPVSAAVPGGPTTRVTAGAPARGGAQRSGPGRGDARPGSEPTCCDGGV